MGPVKMVVRHVRKAMDMKNLLVVNFLVLFFNLFVIVMQLNHGIYPMESYFQPVMEEKDKQNMLKTLKAFTSALDRHNLTYFIYGGTLLGSFRHHGFIPWDDDVDIMLNASQKPQLYEALTKLRPEYELYMYGTDVNKKVQWKFYLNSLDGLAFQNFKWPYLDIFFFDEDQDYVWDNVGRFAKDYRWAKKDVFPLTRRPFEDLMLWSPCNSEGILRHNYKTELCRSRQFSHMMEVPMFTFSTRDVPCYKLSKMFPFVHRTYMNGVMNESLELAGWTLHNHILPSHCPGLQASPPQITV